MSVKNIFLSVLINFASVLSVDRLWTVLMRKPINEFLPDPNQWFAILGLSCLGGILLAPLFSIFITYHSGGDRIPWFSERWRWFAVLGAIVAYVVGKTWWWGW